MKRHLVENRYNYVLLIVLSVSSQYHLPNFVGDIVITAHMFYYFHYGQLSRVQLLIFLIFRIVFLFANVHDLIGNV